MNISLSAFVPESLVLRDGYGSPVARQPAHLHTQAESGFFLLRDSSEFPRRAASIYLFKTAIRHRINLSYRVTHLRTDGVHWRESAGTGGQ